MSDYLLDDLVDWLAATTGLGVGSALFGLALPEDAALATVVTATGGPAQRYEPGRVATFQVLTRGDDYTAARAQSRAIYDAIYPPPHRLPARNVDLSADWRALTIDAIQPPADIGRSESGKQQVAFNLQVKALRLPGA